MLIIAQMIRTFVESVLRYGLPVNFVVAMYKVRCFHICDNVVMASNDNSQCAFVTLASLRQRQEIACSALKEVCASAAGAVFGSGRGLFRLVAGRVLSVRHKLLPPTQHHLVL